MNAWSKQDSAAVVILIGMVVAAVVLWPSMPDRLPMHWNAAGQIDRWGGKGEGLLLLPAAACGLYLLLRFLPRLDPRREHVAAFQGVLAVLRLTMVLFMAAVYAAVLAHGLGHPFDVGYVVGLATGLVFAVMGNYLPKVPSNWFVGVRTPWTLSSERSWNLTHRLAGKAFLLAGLALIAITLVRPHWLGAATAVVLTPAVLVPVVYSYLVWRRDPDRLGTSGGAS
jgi:uncharacterized membrane protein